MHAIKHLRACMLTIGLHQQSQRLTLPCDLGFWQHEDCLNQIEGPQVRLSLTQPPAPPTTSNMSQAQFCEAVEVVREHIQAGNVFQLVLSQRFRRSTLADPFEIYRYPGCCSLRF